MKKENSISRRSFLKSSALASALGAVGTGSAASVILTSCGGEKTNAPKPLKEAGTYYIPELPDMAADGKELKAGIIGCGGRGSGATFNFLNAANGVTVVALGDTFQEKVDNLAKKLKDEKGIDIPADKRFVGLDAYKQVIDSGVDVVIIATPPVFRPVHFQYAVEKGKHAFLEKPICVDPVGYRTIMATAKQAAAKNLCVVTGTQRHHQRSYVESYKKIMEGLIGEITGGTVYWNQNMLWYRDRQPGWNDCEYMIKDWVNWKWLSGDHIVEQHVHNIDVFTWFSGLKPVKAVGFGSRQRRVTGDQYDNFSIDFTMENGIHLHSMSRQIDGCANNVSEFIQGTRGSWDSSTMEIKDLAGNVIWKYDSEAEKANFKQCDPYTLEHVNWINTIRAGKLIEQASETAISNMAAIMGRESAYSGEAITWETMTASALDYTPKDLNLGKMDMSGFTVPVPGKPQDKK
ncbi:Gfo/Idh/MocA family oxidoreductase [Parabacteroides chinchillae]|uniref:Tat (Twin-arginine translocation) pathway signal sequence n=1 Tax=Parabacteroides chinchillae TaxID=871327 RepID=A0A8G2BYR6_9BACT|nr:Gfo/Idh/MocA family oxidoreductase [Parabacteroides chinchillae]SEG23197.1 Tat (twin-arginine translocation) pathway signal sequence [Parabacteroides chinchillae]